MWAQDVPAMTSLHRRGLIYYYSIASDDSNQRHTTIWRHIYGNGHQRRGKQVCNDCHQRQGETMSVMAVGRDEEYYVCDVVTF